MAQTSEATSKHVVPIQRGRYSASITPPWFVDKSEYTPKLASFKTLVNGQDAFGDVYRTIESATTSICIICWGFQPSMSFVRDGQHLMIGELLERKAREGVTVRVLCWAYQPTSRTAVNVTGFPLGLGESNTPGRWMVSIWDKPETSSDAQHAYDERFFRIYDRKQPFAGELNRRFVISDDFPKEKLLFTSRTYSSTDRQEVSQISYLDEGVSSGTKSKLKWFPSHHQKMVVVDHDDPRRAVGFVMGHNMLDGYWDTPDHGSQRQDPDKGRNGGRPLHDY